MKSIDSNLACPSCQSALQPKVLCCPNCDIKVEGPFQLNEFATLAPDDLHFLRIFVRCEGRIRDMESALGLSYPTIRTHLSALKQKLAGVTADEVAGAEGSKSGYATGAGGSGKTPGSGQAPEDHDAGRILAKLQAGEIPFDEAMRQIKLLKGRK